MRWIIQNLISCINQGAYQLFYSFSESPFLPLLFYGDACIYTYSAVNLSENPFEIAASLLKATDWTRPQVFWKHLSKMIELMGVYVNMDRFWESCRHENGF